MARPSFTEEDKNIMLQQLEPYLKSGLPLYKACSVAKIPRSTVYYLMDKEEWFLDKIRRFEQYISVLVNTAIFHQLLTVVELQNEGKELARSDIKFLQWMALHSNHMVEEFGRRQSVSVYDPEQEIQRLNGLINEGVS